jgi:hypothetical protein
MFTLQGAKSESHTKKLMILRDLVDQTPHAYKLSKFHCTMRIL